MPDLTPGWALLLAIIALAVLVTTVLVLRPALAKRALEREANAVRPETLLRVLGHGRPILLALDTSGSMYAFGAARDAWAKAFREAGAKVVTFDHQIHIDGEEPRGFGGGTEYEAVRTYVEEQRVHPHVVMLTDGVGMRFQVAQPNLWHWAIVDTGANFTFAERLPGSVYTAREIA